MVYNIQERLYYAYTNRIRTTLYNIVFPGSYAIFYWKDYYEKINTTRSKE